MTKAKVYKLFHFEPEISLRKQIWEVVAKNRNKTINEIKYLKNIRPIEVVALKLIYGVNLNDNEEKLLLLSKYNDFLKEYK